MTTRELPYDLGAEQIVVGAVMQSRAALDEVLALGLSVEHFARPAHQLIFAAVLRLVAKDAPIEPQAVLSELAATGELAHVGGGPYLHTLVETVVTTKSASYYARIVMDQAVRRAMKAAAARLDQLSTAEGELEDLLAQMRQTVDGVAMSALTSSESTLVGDFLPDYLDQLQGDDDLSSRVPLPHRDLQELLGGLRPGQMVVVAGRPGMGKTTVMLDMARHTAIRHQMTTVLVSLEMDRHELTHRIMAAEARVPLHALINKSLTDDDWKRIGQVTGEIGSAPLHIVQRAEGTVEGVGALLESLRRAGTPARLLLVDYLQLMTLRRRSENRQQEVSEISRRLKILAQKYELPIVVGAQLNRGPEQRMDRKPMVADLRESGSIEQDADVVLLLYREDLYEKESPRAGELDLIVGKHRNGPTATVTVAWQGHYARTMDMYPEEAR